MKAILWNVHEGNQNELMRVRAFQEVGKAPTKSKEQEGRRAQGWFGAEDLYTKWGKQDEPSRS